MTLNLHRTYYGSLMNSREHDEKSLQTASIETLMDEYVGSIRDIIQQEASAKAHAIILSSTQQLEFKYDERFSAFTASSSTMKCTSSTWS